MHAGNRWSAAVTVAGEMVLRPMGFRRRSIAVGSFVMDGLEGRGRGGPDVVLLHGLGDRNSTWHQVLLRLRQAPYGRIVAPDLVGFGRSLLPEGATVPALDEGIDLMHRFMEQNFDQPPLLVGNSLGGWLAWRFLARYPDAAAGALLLAPGGFMKREELVSLTQRFIDGDSKVMTQAILGDARRTIRFFGHRIIGSMLRNPLVAEVCRQDARPLLCAPGELKPYRQRVRALWGQDDTLMPISGIDGLRRELGDHLVVDSVGHAPQQSRPGMVLRELKNLVAQLNAAEPDAPSGEPGHPSDAPRPAPGSHSTG
jgi:pimeloyl-ACP methyl ester carboxylesterase